MPEQKMSKQILQTSIAIAAATPVIYALLLLFVYAGRHISNRRGEKRDRLARDVAREVRYAIRASKA